MRMRRVEVRSAATIEVAQEVLRGKGNGILNCMG